MSSTDKLLTESGTGTSVAGSERLFSALRHFYAEQIHARKPLEREHIIAMTGATAVLDQLAFVLGDPGDSIVVPAPRYNAIPEDFQTKALVRCVEAPVTLDEAGTLAEIARVDEVLTKEGNKCKAILIINPHNPLGFCYTREMLFEYARLAEKHNVFLICDEIYATSVYKSDLTDASPFTSILSLDLTPAKVNPARILQIYGASKDFGSNGLRIGVLVCQDNPSFYAGMMAMAPFVVKISSPADSMWSSLLASAELPDYIRKNQEALGEAYAYVTSWLRDRSIPYRPANAGHFVLIDLRKFCASPASVNAEIALAQEMLQGGVYLGPGFSYAVNQPGWFRLTFSIDRQLLDKVLNRLDRIFRKPRSWSTSSTARTTADYEVEGMTASVRNM